MIGDHLKPRLQHFLSLVIEADFGTRQIVQQGHHVFMKQASPMFHAGIAPPGADGAIKRVVSRRRAE
jgi:hypothetical protein